MAVNEVGIYRQARFTTAAAEWQQLPGDQGYEVAFAGRSNAGKSTAINAITGQRALARTSKTPGRTRQIVVFELDAERRLMDLPGYGYAKVPKSVKDRWDEMLDRYFRSRNCLVGLVLIMDIRHPLKVFDQQMLGWCQRSALPCHILLTKADKLKRGPAMVTCEQVARTLRSDGLAMTVQTFSGAKGQGVAQVRQVLDTWLHVAAASPVG